MTSGVGLMRTTVDRVLLAVALLAASGTALSVSAQGLLTAQAQGQPTPAAQAPQVRKLTADEAVRLALENNLGIRIARYDPQIEDLNILGARTNWAPMFSSTFEQTSTENPPNSLLSGGLNNIDRKSVV